MAKELECTVMSLFSGPSRSMLSMLSAVGGVLPLPLQVPGETGLFFRLWSAGMTFQLHLSRNLGRASDSDAVAHERRQVA
jgi:hypothetical protein